MHPQHWDALRLWHACAGQLQLTIGVGGLQWRAAQSVNVQQEMCWLGVAKKHQPKVVAQYRIIEREVLRIMNTRKNKSYPTAPARCL